MEQLIKFRSLSDELKDNEYDQFIMQSIKSQGRNMFNTLIFNAFKNRPESITPFTNIMTNIINSRESTPNVQISYNCLDRLPSALIAECASFLESTEYFSFGIVNRTIYSAIYSPSKIHELSDTNDLSQVDRKRFKNVKKAMIYIEDFNKLSTFKRSIWKTTNCINSLDICIDAGNQTMDQFFDKNDINFENVTKLTFSGTLEMNLASFLKILSRFPMLEYLELNEIFIDENEQIASFNDDIIRMNLEKLKGLRFNEYAPNLDRKLINALSDQLEALSIYGFEDIIISNQKFPKLTELQLHDIDMELLNVFKNVTNIKSAYLWEWGHKQIIQQFIKRMIKNQSFLEQLTVETQFKNVAMTLEAAESALIWTKHKKRESDQLFIEFNYSNKTEKGLMNKMHLWTIRLMNALEMTKIENWRIKIKIDKNANIKRKTNGMKKWLNELENLKENYLIHYEFSQYDVIFIISNKGCKICGYHQNFDI